MPLHPSVIFFGGLVIIILGAEFILRGAAFIAARLGIKPIIIGLTIVSIGTSAPELAVGITAVSEGRGGLAVGNIAGTNIVNILLILGLSATIRALPLQLNSIRLDVPVMIASAIGLLLMAWNGVLSPLEGGILLFGGVVYLILLVRMSRKESQKMQKEFAEEYSRQAQLRKRGNVETSIFILLLIGGIVLTVLGAELLVAGAVRIAQSYGVSDAVIGLTIVAIGTSAPELVTTIVATLRNDRDVAIGNLIGSSITNILVILGITSLTAVNGVDISKEIRWFDLPLAAAVAIACYPVFKSSRSVSRLEGLSFIIAYLVYLTTLLLLRT